jgi:hypothetical protein
MCSVLIGLNVVATFSGIYTPSPGTRVTTEALYDGESVLAAISQP